MAGGPRRRCCSASAPPAGNKPPAARSPRPGTRPRCESPPPRSTRTLTSPAGPVWLPLSGHTGGQVRLIDLDAALPDPWQDYRGRRARPPRETAEREQALHLADEDDDEPTTYGTAAREEAFGQWP